MELSRKKLVHFKNHLEGKSMAQVKSKLENLNIAQASVLLTIAPFSSHLYDAVIVQSHLGPKSPVLSPLSTASGLPVRLVLFPGLSKS